MSLESEQAMNKVFETVKHVHNRIPRGITEVLELISHPEVIDMTWQWLEREYSDIESSEEEDDDSSMQSGIGGYYA